MFTLEYEDIFSYFHNKVSAYDFLDLSDMEIASLESEYLKSAISVPYVRRLFTSIVADNDDETVSYKMKKPVDEETDQDFVTEILVLGICIEWLNPKVNSVTGIFQTYASKEEKFYSEASHIKEIRALRDGWKLEQRKMIRDRSTFYNSYTKGYDD